MKKRKVWKTAGLAGVCAALLVTGAVAVDAGTDKDPLVTLSYLNDQFMSEIMKRVDGKIAERDKKLAGQGVGSAAASSFQTVELAKGQILTGSMGCEIMLRDGKATCASQLSPGMVDETTGQTVKTGGALSLNHLYMMTEEGPGVQAASNSAKLMVRGTYSVG